MTSNSAKMQSGRDTPRPVVFVVYPDIVLLDLVGPLQIFTHALDAQTGRHGYSTAIVSGEGGPVETNTVLTIPTEPITQYLQQPVHTLVIVGGDGAYQAMRERELVKAITRLGAGATRICSVCSGAVLLAATGFLDGRRAVTHWEDCDRLESLFPQVRVERDPIYIQDGPVWTSAGITTGMDMALAVIAEDLGRAEALRLARSLVTPVMRSGGQSQFSPTLDQQFQDRCGRFEALHAWIADNLQDDLRVETLASQSNMSPRNFARLYSAEMKTTPAKAVETMRVAAARDLLETTTLGVRQIAARCGFRDDERLRRAFLRVLKTSPTDYRRQFHSV